MLLLRHCERPNKPKPRAKRRGGNLPCLPCITERLLGRPAPRNDTPFNAFVLVLAHGHSGCVHTATLVPPPPPPPSKRTRMRFVAGSKGMGPVPITKTPKVGVALALICVVTLGPMAEMHWPVAGFVSQRLI